MGVIVRRKMIAGNWKLHKGPSEGVALAKGVVAGAAGVSSVDLAICPPFVTLAAVADVVRGSGVLLGGQDVHWEKSGAFTGEVSAEMLAEVGCQLVIIGHSERRHVFGESDEEVARKLVAAQRAGLTPIVCVGEKLAEREAGKTWDVVSRQVTVAYGQLSPEEAARTIVAYEPVWAIGTGKVATPEQAVEVHGRIRSWFKHRFGDGVASGLRVLYGGSVKPDNAHKLMQEEEIDGALVGGACLEANSFLGIAEAV